jgi:hypothetical protein
MRSFDRQIRYLASRQQAARVRLLTGGSEGMRRAKAWGKVTAAGKQPGAGAVADASTEDMLERECTVRRRSCCCDCSGVLNVTMVLPRSLHTQLSINAKTTLRGAPLPPPLHHNHHTSTTSPYDRASIQ